MAAELEERDRRFELRMQDMKQEIIAEVGAGTTAGEGRRAENEGLAARVTALENRSTAAGSVASVATGVRRKDPQEPFTPTKVTLQWLGDGDDFKDEDNMTTDQEAADFVEQLWSSGMGLALFDKEATLRANKKPLATKIILRIKSDHGLTARQVDRDAWDFKRALEQRGDLKIRGRRPRAWVQARPEVEEMIDMTGRALGILRKHGLGREELKPQWQPSKVFVKKAGGRAAMIVEWSAKNGWGVSEANMIKHLPGVTPQQLLAELNQWRRRNQRIRMLPPHSLGVWALDQAQPSRWAPSTLASAA